MYGFAVIEAIPGRPARPAEPGSGGGDGDAGCGADFSRRAALKLLGASAVGVMAAGCTPLRIVLHDYPDVFDQNQAGVERILRAFVTTVVPEAPIDDKDLVRVYYDEFYRLAPYRSFFASDLCERGRRSCGVYRFDRVSPEQRLQVVQDGLAADATTRKLYSGAIFLAQLSFYAGVFDDEKGCPLIDFEGRYRVRPLHELVYPNPEEYLGRSLTADGNVS